MSFYRLFGDVTEYIPLQDFPWVEEGQKKNSILK